MGESGKMAPDNDVVMMSHQNIWQQSKVYDTSYKHSKFHPSNLSLRLFAIRGITSPIQNKPEKSPYKIGLKSQDMTSLPCIKYTKNQK